MASEIESPSNAFLSIENNYSEMQMHNTTESSMDDQKKFPWLLDYISCLSDLAVFGILGVLTRYILQKLFGPDGAGLTSDGTALYLDLPPNIVGSFLMGWLGIVFKESINGVFDLLATGLTTGFLGSLTTFSGWNQKMLELATDGRWVVSIFGYAIGMSLTYINIEFGVWTAKGFRWLLGHYSSCNSAGRRVDAYMGRLVALLVFVLALGMLWAVSGALLKIQWEANKSSAQLWLACMVGPAGVWLRWYLARLNGRGLGREGLMKWIPFGTLIANVVAACLMAALDIGKKVMKMGQPSIFNQIAIGFVVNTLEPFRYGVNTKQCGIAVDGIHIGFLGNLSTVSTFVAEIYTMVHSDYPWRAVVYIALMLISSFVSGMLVYSVPVWTKRY